MQIHFLTKYCLANFCRVSDIKRIPLLVHFFRLQRSCGQGNIFTPVCHSFCSQGGVCISACWDTTPPQDQTPHSPEQTPPRPDPHPRTRPPRADPPSTRPPRQTPPLDQTPPDQTPPGSRLQHTVYERPVRILLECILLILTTESR